MDTVTCSSSAAVRPGRPVPGGCAGRAVTSSSWTPSRSRATRCAPGGLRRRSSPSSISISHDYGRGRTLQPITGFRTGLIGRTDDLETRYDHPVSYGIRRCEFDHYLLAAIEGAAAARRRPSSASGATRARGSSTTRSAPPCSSAPAATSVRWHALRLRRFGVTRRSWSSRRRRSSRFAARDSASFTTEASTPELYFFARSPRATAGAFANRTISTSVSAA